MRSIVLAVFVLFSSLGMMAQSNIHTVLHQDGLFGGVSAVSGDTSLFLQISHGTDFFTGQPTTFLLYDTFVQSPNGFTDTFAIGTIPNDSIKGNDPAHVVLDVDTSQLTTISTTFCTFTFPDFTQTCGQGALGVIHLEWRQNQTFTLHTVGEQQQVFVQGRLNFHEVSDSASAAITGSFLGLDITNGVGQIGFNHSSSVDLFMFH